MAIDINNPAELPPAICLMGPTASGKTDLAIRLSEVLPCELISVDSALVYKGMDIGTAKPTAEEQARAPHRLIDIKDPSEPYSAAMFREDALDEMADITARGKIPLLVGGTMLYFKILRMALLSCLQQTHKCGNAFFWKPQRKAGQNCTSVCRGLTR